MNKTGIEWADLTWNPIVGCNNGCSYCYARRLATTRLAHLCPQCATFEPHLHEERLDQPMRVKKPALIFADSMSDWWSDGVKRQWRADATTAMANAPQHRFVVLTKRPEQIGKWDIEYWPPNAWLGVSITSGADWWRWEVLAKLPGHIHKFISVEPLLGRGVGAQIQARHRVVRQYPEWVIVGPQSGPDAVPVDDIWQMDIRYACATESIPLFEKSGLPIQPPIRQMPADLKAVFRKGGVE